MPEYPVRVYHILMYGGAALVVFGIVFLLALLSMLYKANRLLTKGKEAVQLVTNSLLLPVFSILSMVAPLLSKRAKK